MSSVLTLFGVMLAIFIPVGIFVFMVKYMENKRTTSMQILNLREELEANSIGKLETEIAELKQRIIVLESIVTERGYEVERKISNL